MFPYQILITKCLFIISILALSRQTVFPLFSTPPFDVAAQLQGYVRGWLIRRRWWNVVEQYLKSPSADLMKKRNQVIAVVAFL